MALINEVAGMRGQDQLASASFLEIDLYNDVNRGMELRVQPAALEETCRLEDFDSFTAITLD